MPVGCRCRVAMARLGVATPVLQWKVACPGGIVLGTADFGWPDHGYAAEFDEFVEFADCCARARCLLTSCSPRSAGTTACAVLHGFARWGWDEVDAFEEVARRLPR